MMSLNELLEMSDDLSIIRKEDEIRIQFGDLKTNWICCEDPFIERISPENLNMFFRRQHLKKEIEIRNILDEGIDFLNCEKYPKAIDCFDKVLYYDSSYSQALVNKSHALFHQGHFVKALRFFKKSDVEDIEYYKLLLKKSSQERDNFPKIKRNIYEGDEAASRGEFKRAIDFYDKALDNPSGFKNKILFKLLNKKAFALIELERFDEALAGFDASLGVHENDLAQFGSGYCQYRLGLDCIGRLSRARKIDKRHLLVKACIFNELEYCEDALKCFNEFLANHFALDDDFACALQGKVTAMEGLALDNCNEKKILSQIMDKSY